jgi:Holliday junction resolvase RusA-like endonuclease
LFTYCGIRVHSKRKRLADPDGLSIKAVLDGLTKAGVFADDNAKRIKEVRFTQEQSSVEETIIEILEAT